jgi:uncharacterized YigZ family protein
MSYSRIANIVETELVVKKSRFIARCVPIASREEAMAAVAQARLDYPDARHHCWAYLLGDPADAANAGASDDGEPSGTAGKPILNVVSHSQFGDLAVIVIRYFGGIKLGAGGLVRAYSSAAGLVLEEAIGVPVEKRLLQDLQCPFSQEQSVRHWLGLHDGIVSSVQYGDEVTLSVEIAEPLASILSAFCLARGITVLEN